VEAATVFMCAGKQNIGKTIVLPRLVGVDYAVIKMVETTHRSRLTGGGFNRGEAELMSTLKKYFANKPPKGAVVKSPREIGAGYGAERLGA